MIRWLGLGVIVVALSAAAAWFSTTPEEFLNDPSTLPLAAPLATEGPPPAVLVEGETTHEFGVMAQQKRGHFEWVIRNDGPGDLVLEGTEPPCSCMTPQLKAHERVTVKPGEPYTYKVGWDTKTFSGDWGRTFTINTNDPKRPRVSLSIHGTISPAIVTFPSDVIDLHSVTNVEAVSFPMSALIASPDRPETKIVSITSSRPDLLEVTAEPLTPEQLEHVPSPDFKSGFTLKVTVKPTASLGSFREEIIVKTDHPDREEARLTVVGKVVGPISLMPPLVRLGEVSSQKGGTTEIGLWVQGQEETEFSVASAPNNLKVAIAPVDDKTKAASNGHPYRMTVTVEPSTPPGLINDPITLKTNHPKAGEVKVPVYILVVGEG